MSNLRSIGDVARRHLDRLILSAMGPVKECPGCFEFLPHDAEFFFLRSDKRRLHSRCKACTSEKKKGRVPQ